MSTIGFKFCRLFLVFSLTLRCTLGVQLSNYVNLIFQVHWRHDRAPIFLMNHDISGLKETKELCEAIYLFSRNGIRTSALSFKDVSHHHRPYRTRFRPLIVVTLKSAEDVEAFAKFTEKFQITYPVWFLIINVDSSILEKIRDENMFHLTFDTVMLVVENDSGNIQEWYALKNETRTADLASWDPESGLVYRNPGVLYQRRKNLENSTILVVVTDNDRAVQPRENYRIHDMFFHVILDLATVLNFTIKFVRPLLTSSDGLKKARYESALEVLVAGNADITPTEMGMTRARLAKIDYTHPVLMAKKKLYIKHVDGGIHWSGYVEIFTPAIWIAIGVSIALTTILSTIATAVNRERTVYDSFVEQFLIVLGIYCQQGLAESPTFTSLRISYYSSFVTAVIVSAAYSASLISHITFTIEQVPFSSLEEFVRDGSYKLIVNRNDINHKQFLETQDDTYRKIRFLMKPPEELPVTLTEAGIQVCEDKVAFYRQQVGVDVFVALAPCKLHVIDLDTGSNLAIPMSKGNQFYGVFNYYIKRFQNNGVMNRFILHYLTEIDESTATFDQVDFTAVSPIFAAFSMCVVFAVILLFLEHTFYTRFVSVKEKNPNTVAKEHKSNFYRLIAIFRKYLKHSRSRANKRKKRTLIVKNRGQSLQYSQ